MSYTEKEIDEVLLSVKKELLKANKKKPPVLNSSHEGYGVMKEEFDEMWDDIKEDLISHSILECIQVGAMAVKYILSMRIVVDKEICGKI